MVAGQPVAVHRPDRPDGRGAGLGRRPGRVRPVPHDRAAGRVAGLVPRRAALGGPAVGARADRPLAPAPATARRSPENGSADLWDLTAAKPHATRLITGPRPVTTVASGPAATPSGSPGTPPSSAETPSDLAAPASGSAGTIFATGDAAGRVVLWDPAAGDRPDRRLTGHTERVTGLAFSPDGRTLASASDDDSITPVGPGPRGPAREAAARRHRHGQHRHRLQRGRPHARLGGRRPRRPPLGRGPRLLAAQAVRSRRHRPHARAVAGARPGRPPGPHLRMTTAGGGGAGDHGAADPAARAMPSNLGARTR
ncbi:hypothetical protein [Nonomuraea sp. NPDC050691]|uniref:hypothetical protein n=1 Tax=Nonomuraea sp. NPDC050691 TaxID=3155661 RepID=UPI0033D4E24F